MYETIIYIAIGLVILKAVAEMWFTRNEPWEAVILEEGYYDGSKNR